MAFYNYEIGGNEVPKDASEAIVDIPANRTLMVEKLTDDDPLSPEAVYGLKTVEEVFEHFQPSIKVEFATEEGEPKEETLSFKNLSDFGVKSISQQSSFLSELEVRQAQLDKMSRQFASNKVLMRAVNDMDTKSAIIDLLEEALAQLKAAEVVPEEA
jgi:hypothetical protein